MEFINSKLATSERRRREAHSPFRICSYCKKREPSDPRPEQTLKRCSRCRVSLYCSRSCQRADWKRGHQRTCISAAIMARKSCYLDGLQSEEMAMDQLLDAYRLRVEDERMYCGRLRGRYTTDTSTTDLEGNEDSNSQARQAAFQDFQAFLDLAESESHNNNEGHRGDSDAASPSSSATIDTDTDNSSSSSPPPSASASSPPTANIATTNITATKEKETAILPRWWNAEKRALCEARALDESDEIWSSLRHPAGKAEILDHYRDNLMPMKLRMLAERVYGSDVMGQSRS